MVERTEATRVDARGKDVERGDGGKGAGTAR